MRSLVLQTGVVVLSLGLTAAPFGTGTVTEPSPTVTFTGTVTARTSGSPVAGAQVTLVGRSAGTLTDRRGHYRFSVPGVRGGSEVQLRVRLLGYATTERTVTVDSDSIRVDFELQVRHARVEEMTVTPSTFAATPPGSYYPPGFNTESYDRIEEEAFRSPLLHPLSTFAADVDRASYANVRRFLTGGELPPVDAVRIEELVNTSPTTTRSPRRVGPSPSPPRWRPRPGGRPTGWCGSACGPRRSTSRSSRPPTWSSCSTSRARWPRRTSCRW